jgi:hypothetical protein
MEPESQFGDLDHILLDQLHNARQSRKIVKRVKKLCPNDPLTLIGEELIEKRIQFYESMISEKTLLRKKHKRKKHKNIDILAKNPVYEWYKTVFMATTFGYKMFSDSVSSYMSYFKKGKN